MPKLRDVSHLSKRQQARILATRASIIETLFKRGYMERCKKSLVPTEKGLALNSVVKTMRIADVAMTGEWEKELARIERGELSVDTFRKKIEAYTREITSELLSCDKLFGSRDSGCACPKCGTSNEVHIIDDEENRRFLIWRIEKIKSPICCGQATEGIP